MKPKSTWEGANWNWYLIGLKKIYLFFITGFNNCCILLILNSFLKSSKKNYTWALGDLFTWCLGLGVILNAGGGVCEEGWFQLDGLITEGFSPLSGTALQVIEEVFFIDLEKLKKKFQRDSHNLKISQNFSREIVITWKAHKFNSS